MSDYADLVEMTFNGTPESAAAINAWMMLASDFGRSARFVHEVTEAQAKERSKVVGETVAVDDACLFLDQPDSEPIRIEVGQTVGLCVDGGFERR